MRRVGRARQRVAMDPSVSIGLGHLMRLACLRRVLKTPVTMLGPVDAELDDRGLSVRSRRTAVHPNGDGNVIVVDRNIIGPAVLGWRLANPSRRLVWIKRGLGDEAQAVRQSGFVRFADMVVVPGDIGGESDHADDLAAARGKLRRVGVCHVYQVVHPTAALDETRDEKSVFMSLGAFEPAQRTAMTAARDAVVRAGLPYVWSAYSDEPLGSGFPPNARVAAREAVGRKSRSAAFVSEGGYNSVHEALHLKRPALFIANDGGGRERQSRRVAAAKRLSPLVFDARRRGDVTAWLDAAQSDPPQRTTFEAREIHDRIDRGFDEMADIVETFLAEGAERASG